MTTGRGIAIAGALIAGALLARAAWTQATVTGFTTGIVVTACGTAPFTSGKFNYTTAGNQVPITINTAGSLCVNQ